MSPQPFAIQFSVSGLHLWRSLKAPDPRKPELIPKVALLPPPLLQKVDRFIFEIYEICEANFTSHIWPNHPSNPHLLANRYFWLLRLFCLCIVGYLQSKWLMGYGLCGPMALMGPLQFFWLISKLKNRLIFFVSYLFYFVLNFFNIISKKN